MMPERNPDKQKTRSRLQGAPVCPRFHRASELLGKRWTGAIIQTLLAGSHRFGEILESVDGLSDRLLSERLKELEGEGIIERRVYPKTPVLIEYHLTNKGLELRTVLESIQEWAHRWYPVLNPENNTEPMAADR